MVQFRILERRTNGAWTPFGVAYERDGRVVLFAPPWRADRTLAVASLEELDARHSPSAEFQWRAVETTDAPVQHPIEWLQRALEALPAAQTQAVMQGTASTPHGAVPVEIRVGKGINLASRLKRAWAILRRQGQDVGKGAGLATGLQRLERVSPALQGRLAAWREQIERGDTCAEAAVRAILSPGQAGTVEVVPELSHPSLQAAYAGTSFRNKGGETAEAGQAASTVTVTTDAIPGARVTVEGNAVVVTFLDWQAPSPPLVILVPDDPGSTPQTPDLLEGEAGSWTARFERIATGAYLLAIAPVSA